MSYSIYHDLEIKGSPQKIFESITTPEHLINWWPLKCKGVPKENEAYNFHFTPEYDWYGKVVQLEKNKSFHISMTRSDDDWAPTTFGFDLIPIKDKVQVRFFHVGWPECNDHFRRSSYCWAMLLNGLKNYVEKGIIIPFEERS